MTLSIKTQTSETRLLDSDSSARSPTSSPTSLGRCSPVDMLVDASVQFFHNLSQAPDSSSQSTQSTQDFKILKEPQSPKLSSLSKFLNIVSQSKFFKFLRSLTSLTSLYRQHFSRQQTEKKQTKQENQENQKNQTKQGHINKEALFENQTANHSPKSQDSEGSQNYLLKGQESSQLLGDAKILQQQHQHQQQDLLGGKKYKSKRKSKPQPQPQANFSKLEAQSQSQSQSRAKYQPIARSESESESKKTGLYGKPAIPKWFHSMKSKLSPAQRKLKKEQQEEILLQLKEELYKAQKLTQEDLKKLKEAWAKIMNIRDLPKKERDKALKEMVLESFQGNEALLKHLKSQWRMGGAIWGAGLGVPYLLLASGTYLGLVGKAALSIGATAFSALPNGYLEIALETTMGMIYDAEPNIDKGILNAMPYSKIYKGLKEEETKLKILTHELKKRYEQWQANPSADHQTLLEFAQKALIGHMQTYMMPLYDEYLKQNAQTKSGFCDSSRAVVSALGLLLAVALSAGGVAATLKIPPLALSAAVLGGTLCARIIASSFDKARLRESRIINNLKYANVLKNDKSKSSEARKISQACRIIDPEQKFLNENTFKELFNQASDINFSQIEKYTADDIDDKKIEELWKTAAKTRTTLIEKIIAYRLSKTQVKFEKAVDDFLAKYSEMAQANHLDGAEPAHVEYEKYAKYAKIQKMISSIRFINQQRNNPNLTSEEVLILLKHKNELFSHLEKEFEKVISTEAGAKNKKEKIINKINIFGKKNQDIVSVLKQVMAMHEQQQVDLKNFHAFKTHNFKELDKNHIIYKCVLNDRFLLKQGIKARYKMAGVVISQVMRNIGGTMGSVFLSPLVLNATVGLGLEEGAGMIELMPYRTAAVAAGGAIYAGMASHEKHHIQTHYLSEIGTPDVDTLSVLDYMPTTDSDKTSEKGASNHASIVSIAFPEMGPTYNKGYSRKKRWKHQFNAAVDVALYMPFRNIKTWIQASIKMHQTEKLLRKTKGYFANDINHVQNNPSL